MKIKCENVVRCGNRNCIHNTNGYYCQNIVISLDAFGVCAFRNSKASAPTVCNTATKPPVVFDFEEDSK